MSEDQRPDFEAPTPWGPIKVRSIDALMMLLIITVAACCAMLYLVFDQGRDSAAEIKKALNELSVLVREQVVAQRFGACVQALPEKMRLEQVEKESSYCHGVSNYR